MRGARCGRPGAVPGHSRGRFSTEPKEYGALAPYRSSAAPPAGSRLRIPARQGERHHEEGEDVVPRGTAHPGECRSHGDEHQAQHTQDQGVSCGVVRGETGRQISPRRGGERDVRQREDEAEATKTAATLRVIGPPRAPASSVGPGARDGAAGRRYGHASRVLGNAVLVVAPYWVSREVGEADVGFGPECRLRRRRGAAPAKDRSWRGRTSAS